jgi:prepilin-type N-terminal cleavage/methylation domain-containing protein/prepilin-type processing-associated H-X9-DG protein
MLPTQTFVQRRVDQHSNGFTLIELLVVIAILGVLAALLLPSLGVGKKKAVGTSCLNNNRQLLLSFQMYADDNNGACVPNEDEEPRYAWVKGKLNYQPDNLDNTNTIYLTNPKYALFARYGLGASIYKCPADRSSAPIFGQMMPRTRSISLNQAIGINELGRWLPSLEFARPGQKYYQVYRKVQDIGKPSQLFAFIDEQPDSVNDPAFATVIPDDPSTTRFIDLPAWYHNGASTISFCDGHTENHRWLDGRTKVPILGRKQLSISMPYSQDVIWLTERASSLAGTK